MKISLIISLYNRLDLLHKCLIAIKNQSRLPDEIVFTDDGSEDDAFSFVKEHARLFNIPIKLVQQEHKGFRLARIRNNGVYASEGDLLLFMDQDIITPPDYIHNFERNTKAGRFLVSYPIRLSMEQSAALDDVAIGKGQFKSILNHKQLRKPIKQFYKDRINVYLYFMHLAKYGAKLRGGVSGILRKDYIRVNGYDENFIGWGNEDDDMGRRLLASGVVGVNVTKGTFPLHLYHPPYHSNALRVNKDYAKETGSSISASNYTCKKGYNNDRSDLVINVFR